MFRSFQLMVIIKKCYNKKYANLWNISIFLRDKLLFITGIFLKDSILIYKGKWQF